MISEVADIPDSVKLAPFSRIAARTITQSVVETLTTKTLEDTSSAEWIHRIRLRRKALLSYVGRTLVCVFVKLPGIHYTLEIDPQIGQVVYWESQT